MKIHKMQEFVQKNEGQYGPLIERVQNVQRRQQTLAELSELSKKILASGDILAFEETQRSNCNSRVNSE